MGNVTVTDYLELRISDDAEIVYHNGHVLLHLTRDGDVVADNRLPPRTLLPYVAPPTRWQRVRRWVVNMVTLK